jgi:hypothetical protein
MEFEGCFIAGCDKKHSARGYCNRHYRQQRREGVLYDEAQKCKIDDCVRVVCARGLCQLHYERVRNTGNPHLKKRRYQKVKNKAGSLFVGRMSNIKEELRREALQEAGINPDLV